MAECCWEQVGQVSSSGLKELLADTRELSERPDGQAESQDVDISNEKFKSIRYCFLLATSSLVDAPKPGNGALKC